MKDQESHKSRIQIARPWFAELEVEDPEDEIKTFTLDSKAIVRFNLISEKTGEIRARYVTVDKLARHVFNGIIHNKNSDIEVEKR